MWYRYEDELFNLNSFTRISKSRNGLSIILYDNRYIDKEFVTYFNFETEIKRDAEFEKICKLLGLDEPEHISRCC